MMKKFRFSILVLLMLLFVASCSSDDDFVSVDPDDPETPEMSYSNGFFVLNEGQFPNEGTLTFVSHDLQTVEQNVFQNVNDGMELGNTPQSMFFDDQDRAFIITNSSNFVRVADRYTMEDLGIISGDMNNPRYGVALGNKAYITNGNANHLTILDLEELSIEGTLDIGGIGEFIEEANGLLYIQQAAYGFGNKIVVVDPNTESVVETLTTDSGLNSISLTSDYLFALSSTGVDQFSLTDHSLTHHIDLPSNPTPANLIVQDGILYFTAGSALYKMSLNPIEIPEMVFEYDSNSPYGMFYGFTIHNDRIYIADGGDFASDSFIEVREINGNLLKTVDVGVGPNGFYFND